MPQRSVGSRHCATFLDRGRELGAERIRRVVEEGNRQFSITGTPTFVINGQKVTDPSVVTYAGLSRLLDAAGAGAAAN